MFSLGKVRNTTRHYQKRNSKERPFKKKKLGNFKQVDYFLSRDFEGLGI